MPRERHVSAPPFLVLPGRGTSPGLGCGPLRRNRADLAPREVEGSILVAERAVPDDVGRILSAAGTLTLAGALLSHVSLLSREFGKPSVALGAAGRTSLVPDSEGALLRLDDVVGSDQPAILQEGDVVLIDGDTGTVSVPGGLDIEQRRQVRAVHAPLAAYAKLPDDPNLLAAVLSASEDPNGAAFAYLLEAALLHRIVASGSASRRLLDAFAADAGHARVLESRMTGLRERARARSEARCDAALVVVEAADDVEELDRALRGLEAALQKDLTIFEDIGVDPDTLEEKLEPILHAVAARRAELRHRLEAEVEQAIAIPDDALRNRLGGLFRLLRRARAAHLDERRVAELHARLSQRLAEERARAGIHLVVPLEADSPRDRSLIGGKAGGLLEIWPALPHDCRIPQGFVVTSSAYRLHLLGETGEKLHQATLDGGDDAVVSRRARAALLGGPIPEEVREAIAEAFRALGTRRVAVRSSATIEDAPLASLAGLFDTYLGVEGLPDVFDRIRWAWASLWNARALATLASAGMSPLRAAQAVLVQEMVETRSAGVVFSRDPGGRPDTMLVNAAWGLGEAVSQGEFPGDLYWVRRSTGELIAAETGAITRRIVVSASGPGTVDEPLPPEIAGKPCLTPSDLVRLARLAQALEASTGRAQDVEFGFAPDDGLVVFQIRRIVPHRVS